MMSGTGNLLTKPGLQRRLVATLKKPYYTEDGLHVNSDFLDGLNKEEAIAKMCSWLEGKGFGQEKVTLPSPRLAPLAVNVTGQNQSQSFIGKMELTAVPESNPTPLSCQ